MFEELTLPVRRAARAELDAELQRGAMYYNRSLSAAGRSQFYKLVDDALRCADDEVLERALRDDRLWKCRVNVGKIARAIAITEFNTWYVRGLCRVLLDEGTKACQVYRAGFAFEPRDECLQHDAQIYGVMDIYAGHRRRYWPAPGEPAALSIPLGTDCHHSIRRLASAVTKVPARARDDRFI
jgi:hypothetical protein